jgi:RNA-directed DNA polymerase
MASPEGSEQDAEELGPGSESISDPVFGTGSLSAFVVLMTPGNAVRADPVEEREASLYRIVHVKHGGTLKSGRSDMPSTKPYDIAKRTI